MTRVDFQQLTRLRLREARRLLAANLAAGAYYLTGHAVECALKACVARQTRRHDFPDKNRARESWDHDLNKLLSLADLQKALDNDAKQRRQLAINWAVVKDWQNASRYQPHITRQQADALYRAVSSRNDGVIRWIRQHW